MVQLMYHEYYVGRIVYRKVTRGTLNMGVDLVNVFDAAQDPRGNSIMQTYQMVNSQRPHFLALDWFMSDRAHRLRGCGIQKSKKLLSKMIKVGRDPTRIHCTAPANSLDINQYNADVGAYIIVDCKHDREYMYNVNEMSVFTDIDEIVREIGYWANEDQVSDTTFRATICKEYSGQQNVRKYRQMLAACLYEVSGCKYYDGSNIDTSSGSNINENEVQWGQFACFDKNFP